MRISRAGKASEQVAVQRPGQPRQGTSKGRGLVVARPGPLQACPKARSAEVGQVPQLSWVSGGDHCPASGPELWGWPVGPSSP